MTKTNPMPLSGGDFIDEGNGLKQVRGSTAPKPSKSEIRAEQEAKRSAEAAAQPKAEPAFKHKADKA